MQDGWIKTYRALREWYGYRSSKRVHLWIELLLRASHQSMPFLFNGKPITLEPGQFVTGRKSLSATTGISESYVEDLLTEFESQGQLQQQKSNTSRLITIVKWENYQACDNASDNKKTTKRQQKDTNKNDNKEKNDKNIKNAEEKPVKTVFTEGDDTTTLSPDFVQSLKDNPLYHGINIDTEIGKMEQWLKVNPAKKNLKRFAINWLARAIDSRNNRPVLSNNYQVKTKFNPKPL
jgi:hypothetical protein